MFLNWKDWNQFIGGIAGNYFVPGIVEENIPSYRLFSHTTLLFSLGILFSLSSGLKKNWTFHYDDFLCLWNFLLEYSFVIYLNWNRFKSLKGDTHFSKFHILYLVFDAFQFSELGSHPWLSVLFRRQYIFSSLSLCCKHFSSLKSLVQPKYMKYHALHSYITSLDISRNISFACQYELYLLYEFSSTFKHDLLPTLGNALEKVWKAGEQNYINLWYQHSDLNAECTKW